ncbi:MAG TPA: GNAT family protein [Fimbriimonadaceae bacterium]|nr:GNAT family protein [Fimbriimonadaceae bacterium]
MPYGWEGKLTRLVPIDIEKHLDNATLWINDVEVTRHLVAGDFPMTRLAEREWMEKNSKQSDTSVTFAIETLGGKHIGFSGLFDIEWRHGTGFTGTMIGDKSEWGRGYGTDAAATRNAYAFDFLGLRMLYSSVFVGNEGSLRMLTKAGYRECGRYPKKLWKRGSYVDEIMLYLERETWLGRSIEQG